LLSAEPLANRKPIERISTKNFGNLITVINNLILVKNFIVIECDYMARPYFFQSDR